MEPGPGGSGDDLSGQRAVCLRQPQRRNRADQATIRRPVLTGNQRGQPVPCLVTSGPVPWQYGGRPHLPDGPFLALPNPLTRQTQVIAYLPQGFRRAALHA